MMFGFGKKKAPTREPKKAARKQYISKTRNFSAGQTSLLNSNWTATPQTADQVVKQTQKTLVARSREQYDNNDFCRRFVTMAKNHVIGEKGITLQSRVADPDGQPDEMAAKAIEAAWANWSKKNNCDIQQQLNLADIARLAIGSAAVDGEYMIRFVMGNASPLGFALQLLDTQQLDVGLCEDLKSGNTIRFSIEYDRWARPVAYYFKDHSGDHYLQNTNYVRIPASEILHNFVRDRVGLKRGFPWMSTGLNKLNMLDAFEEASLTNARASASKMGFYTSESGEEYEGDDVLDTGELVEDIEAGIIRQLPNGVKFDSFEPTYPGGEFETFSRHVLRGIASGFGVSYNTLANDLTGVNFSSMRHGAHEEREIWKQLQAWMIEGFYQPIFDRWLSVMLLRGEIKVSGRPLKAERIEKYRASSWQGRRWQWIDPLKDVQANTLSIEQGLKSRSEIIRELGKEPADVWAELHLEKKMLADLGLTVGAPTNKEPQNDED